MNISEAAYRRFQEMRRAEQQAAEMAERVAEMARQPRSHDERVRDATGERIAELQSRLKSGLLRPGEKEQLQRRLEILRAGHAQADAQVKETRRVERFRADHAYQNARVHFEAFARNPSAPVSAEDIALCGAILDSTAWDDPSVCAWNYWREVERVEQAAYERANQQAADAQHAALKADLDASFAAVAAKEREYALAQARANQETPNGTE